MYSDLYKRLAGSSENMATSGAATKNDDDGPVQGLGCSMENFRETGEMDEVIDGLGETAQNDNKWERVSQWISLVLGYYQEQPHMLDPHLSSWMNRLVDAVLGLAEEKGEEGERKRKHAHAAAYVAQQIIKVRGYKVVVRHLPHETHHVEAVLKLLEEQDATQHWETNYVLLLWMSILVLIPFHLARFEQQVMERILRMCKRYLALHNKCQNAAAYMASKFLTRPEIVKEGYLANFLDWSAQTLMDDDSSERNKVGALLGTAAIFKHGTRQDLLPHANTMITIVTNDNLLQPKNGTQVRKLTIKTIQRIGLTFLKAKVATWRYQRGSRSLALNLTSNKVTTGDGQQQAKKEEEADEDEDEYEIPEQTEEVIEQLLIGLRSADTIIRWSAAKGIGRVTGRLPKDLADEVLCSILQLFSLRESDGAWHGGCLAVAELARRGLLLPQRLPEVVQVIEKASVFDERRGNFSVGSHVRDAACYVCWSLARAFGPEVLAEFLPRVGSALLTVAVFDREVNCRRAASAAFQENVGRQGAECLPHAIDILTTVDYFAVGSRQACFTKLAPQLAGYDLKLYGEPLIAHLLDKKVGHWDTSVRELTASAFNQMCQVTPEYMVNQVLPKLLENVETTKDLFVRHGSILSMGQVVLGIASKQSLPLDEILDAALIDRIKNIVSGLEGRMAMRGSGGEIVRTAVTSFIYNMAQAHFPAHTDHDVIELWKIALDETLSSADPIVQEKSVNASAAFVTEYCRHNPHTIVNHYLSNLSETELTRRGYCMALGALPSFALAGRLDDVLPSLIACTTVQSQAEEKWAEGRRDAVRAITNIVKTFGVKKGTNGSEGICEANIVPLYECYLSCLDDYTVDRRGDTGAWVREAAMSGIVALTLEANKNQLVPEVCVEQMMTKLAQQSVEKIDRTRGHAAKSFATILLAAPPITSIPQYQHIKDMFPVNSDINALDKSGFGWTVESETFPIFTRLLRLEAYKERVLLGLVVSVGGLAERLVAQASSSFFAQVEAMTSLEIKQTCDVILKLLEANYKVDRIIIPFFKFLDRLLTSGHLEVVLEDASSDFGLKLFNLIKKEISGCGEPNKLLFAADVLCALLQTEEAVAKQKCLVQLCIFLCHKFPVIRKSTSSKLYEALLTYPTVVQDDDDKLEEINGLLSGSLWDQHSVDKLRPIRNQLCDLLGVPAPAIVKKPV